MQYLVSRKWRDVLVFEGPLPADAAMTKAFEHSVQKFGARIVAHQHFKPGTDPREREQNNPALLSAISRDYDVVFVADDAFDFVRTVPYRLVKPRPVMGGIDLEPMAWHWTWEHNGAPQVNTRLREIQRPPHGGAGLGGVDRCEDDRAVGATHPLGRFRQAARLHPRRRQLRRRQGPRDERAAVGPSVAAGDPAAPRLIRWSPARRSRAFCTRPTCSIRSATTSRNRPAI